MCCPAVYVCVISMIMTLTLNFVGILNFLRKGKVLILRSKYKYQKTGFMKKTITKILVAVMILTVAGAYSCKNRGEYPEI